MAQMSRTRVGTRSTQPANQTTCFTVTYDSLLTSVFNGLIIKQQSVGLIWYSNHLLVIIVLL